MNWSASELPMANLRETFDVNFFGAVAVTLSGSVVDLEKAQRFESEDPHRHGLGLEEDLVGLAQTFGAIEFLFKDDEDHSNRSEELWNVPDQGEDRDVREKLLGNDPCRKHHGPGK